MLHLNRNGRQGISLLSFLVRYRGNRRRGSGFLRHRSFGDSRVLGTVLVFDYNFNVIVLWVRIKSRRHSDGTGVLVDANPIRHSVRFIELGAVRLRHFSAALILENRSISGLGLTLFDNLCFAVDGIRHRFIFRCHHFGLTVHFDYGGGGSLRAVAVVNNYRYLVVADGGILWNNPGDGTRVGVNGYPRRSAISQSIGGSVRRRTWGVSNLVFEGWSRNRHGVYAASAFLRSVVLGGETLLRSTSVGIRLLCQGSRSIRAPIILVFNPVTITVMTLIRSLGIHGHRHRDIVVGAVGIGDMNHRVIVPCRGVCRRFNLHLSLIGIDRNPIRTRGLGVCGPIGKRVTIRILRRGQRLGAALVNGRGVLILRIVAIRNRCHRNLGMSAEGAALIGESHFHRNGHITQRLVRRHLPRDCSRVWIHLNIARLHAAGQVIRVQSVLGAGRLRAGISVDGVLVLWSRDSNAGSRSDLLRAVFRQVLLVCGAPVAIYFQPRDSAGAHILSVIYPILVGIRFGCRVNSDREGSGNFFSILSFNFHRNRVSFRGFQRNARIVHRINRTGNGAGIRVIAQPVGKPLKGRRLHSVSNFYRNRVNWLSGSAALVSNRRDSRGFIRECNRVFEGLGHFSTVQTYSFNGDHGGVAAGAGCRGSTGNLLGRRIESQPVRQSAHR